MFKRIRTYVRAIQARDPACRSVWEVVFSYPGFHAIVIHRLAHPIWRARWYWLARWISQWGRFITGIEIHPGAVIGHNVFIDHGMGVVIGETAEIGDDCTIYQGVTLGGTQLERGTKRHPTLGQGVTVGAYSQVLGGFTVGNGAKIGSGAVVTKPVPPGATAVGNPARIIDTDNRDITNRTAKSLTHEQALRSFLAYGITSEEDPLSKALRDMSNTITTQAGQISSLQQLVTQLASKVSSLDPANTNPNVLSTQQGQSAAPE
jgi:serine O-acetyltransferase